VTGKHALIDALLRIGPKTPPQLSFLASTGGAAGDPATAHCTVAKTGATARIDSGGLPLELLGSSPGTQPCCCRLHRNPQPCAKTPSRPCWATTRAPS